MAKAVKVMPLRLPPRHERQEAYRRAAAAAVVAVPGAKVGPWANAHEMHDDGAFVDVSVWIPAASIALPREKVKRRRRKAKARPRKPALRVIPGGRNGHGRRKQR